MYNYCFLFIVFFLYSVLGYIVEVTCVSLKEKRVNLNRGFLIGPYLPIFGIGGLFMSLFLIRYYNLVLELFVMSMISCMLIEYFSSLILEKLFNLRWWDYSDKKYNINGRICLETGVLFGFGGLIVVRVIDPVFIKILLNVPNFIIIIFGLLFTLIFIIDLIVSIKIILRVKISIDKYSSKDATDEIKCLIRNELSQKSLLVKRLLKSFPNAKDQKQHSISKLLIKKDR